MSLFYNFIVEELIPPKYYWLMMDIPRGDWRHNHDDVVNQLKARELHGVKGISKSRKIFTQMFHTTRNTALIMPAEATRALNPHLRDVDYENADSLMANHMHDLHRIFEKNPGKSGTNQVFGHIFEYGDRKDRFFGSDAFNRGQNVHDVLLRHHGETPPINSVADFAHHVNHALALDQQDEDDYRAGRTDKKPILGGSWSARDKTIEGLREHGGAEQLAHKAAKGIAKIYGDEAEVAVDAPSLKIPHGSRLIIHSDPSHEKSLRDMHPAFVTDHTLKSIAEYDRWHKSIDELAQHYPIKHLNSFEYAQARARSSKKNSSS